MIFLERRLASIFAVFLVSVFFLCVFEYRFIVAAAIIPLFFSALFFVLRFLCAKYGNEKLKLVFGGAAACFLSAACAVLYYMARHEISEKPAQNYLAQYENEPVCIKAEIKNVSSVSFMSVFDLSVFEVDEKKANRFNLSLLVYGEIEAGDEEIGDILESYVVFKSIEEIASSDFDAAYFKSGGYYIAADYYDYEGDGDENISESFKITPAEPKPLGYYMNLARRRAGEALFGNVKLDYHDTKTEEAALAYGIFTGDKGHISPGVKTDFKKAGIAHVLAVSGMHLSILCWIIFLFLNFLKIHKKISCAFIILCCLSFMAFTGFSVSMIRAGIMTILFYLAFLAGRKSDPVTSLFFAGIVIVLLNPYNILNIGFQLSFFSTLGILAASGLNGKIASAINKAVRFKFLKRALQTIASSVGVSLAASFFTIPFVAYNFKTLSVISPLSNLFSAPVVTVILVLALFISIFSFVPFLSAFFGLCLYYMAKLLLFLANFFGSFAYSYISAESTGQTGFHIYSFVFLAVIALCFVLPKLSEKKFIKPVLGTALALCFFAMAASLIYPRISFAESLRVAYYSDDLNQNIILFQGDYDSADIIDMTHGTKSHVKPVFEIMLSNGAVRINSIVFTDYRKRHVQMLKKYMEYSEIKKVYIPEPRDEYDIEVLNMLYYLSIAKNNGQNFELLKYDKYLVSEKALLSVTNFEYGKMSHLAAEIYYRTQGAERRLLYLGIGYMEGYEKHSDINEKKYDIVFYGTHKHNRRDDDYVSDVYGLFAGVLSSYLDGEKNKTTQKLGANAIDAYRIGPLLLKSDDYGSVVFEIKKDGTLKYFLK
ncbi:MAG: ComEC/Rec2 family competence protein [Oscillospiraceae bacterium]|nr:ComEC/Rec2 family competence protein [Oscillospiraceae bacterium]